MNLSYENLLARLNEVVDGELFSFSTVGQTDQGGMLGASQVLRTLVYSDVPQAASPESGLYLWSNNPERVGGGIDGGGFEYLMSLDVTGSPAGIVRDLGVNVVNNYSQSRNVIAFFKPDGAPISPSPFAVNFLGASPKGLIVTTYNNAVGGGRNALAAYNDTAPGTYPDPSSQPNGWYRVVLGTLPAGLNINAWRLLTGLVRVRFRQAGRFVLAMQPGTKSPPLSVQLAATEKNADGICLRRNRGTFASRSCFMNTNGVLPLPDPTSAPSDVSMQSVAAFTYHENDDVPGLDIDWVQPVHGMPGDDVVDMPRPIACDANNKVPRQFQGNYQFTNTVTARVVNTSRNSIQVALIAVRATVGQEPIAFFDVNAGRIVPTNDSFGARRSSTQQVIQMIRISTETVPACTIYDIRRTLELVNGSAGRLYFMIVPIVAGSIVAPAPTAIGSDPCKSTSASTVSTAPSTSWTSYTSSATASSGTTTGSTTGTGGTPNTLITPDTGVTPDSGTNSGSGTPVSSGTGTPITMVTNDTPVTPGPG